MTLAELIPSLRSSLPHDLEPWLWPSSTHHIPGGDLSVGGTSLVGVAAQHGTPAYVLDTAEFRARCATYRHTFHDEDVAYAGKALLTRAIARMVDEEGLRLDVCSEGELAVAVAAQFPADRIILHGNAKPSALLRRAMPMGVGRIVIDSLDEIETLAAVAFGAGRQRVLLRVTPGVDAHTHNAVTTGTEGQKFGCPSNPAPPPRQCVAFLPCRNWTWSGCIATSVRRSRKLPPMNRPPGGCCNSAPRSVTSTASYCLS